jgi:hypothetical protein
MVIEYRRRAEECYALALTAVPDHKTLILSMAETWEILARQRESMLRLTPGKSISEELPWRPTHLPQHPPKAN